MNDVLSLSLQNLLTLALTSEDEPECGESRFFPTYKPHLHGKNSYPVPRTAKNIYIYEVAIQKKIERLSETLSRIPRTLEDERDKIETIITELMLKLEALKNTRDWLIADTIFRDIPEYWDDEEDKDCPLKLYFQIYDGWIFTTIPIRTIKKYSPRQNSSNVTLH